MTRGYKTTEFWLTAGTYIGGLLNLTGAWDFLTNWQSGVLITISTGVYALARGVAKHGQT